MFDTRKLLHDDGIIEIMRILAANRESGTLEIIAGTMEGAIFFRAGQLVDACMGHLTGFRAINAIASMRDARFTFDPSGAPPTASSITANERIVLKQFFGIEAVDLNDLQEQEEYSNTPPAIAEQDEEVTLETTGLPSDALRPSPAPTRSTNWFHRGALIIAALFVLVAAAAVTLRNEFRERELRASVPATTAPPAAQVAEAATVPVPESSSVPVAESPAASVAKPASAPVIKPASAPVVKTASAPVAEPSARDLSGKWTIVNTVHKTAYRSFENLKIGFDLAINQNGKQFTGKGVKVSENGRSLPADSRTPIQVTGSIDGDRIEATFIEDGTLRRTNGRFVWRIDKAGAISGTFNSTAASSSGKSAARRDL